MTGFKPILALGYSDVPSLAYVNSDEDENINVYKYASEAVVIIRSSTGNGAGCIVDPSGLIITNKHVIGRSYRLTVELKDGSSYPASVMDVDNDDLAVLKINASKPLPYIKLADSTMVQVGQRVLAIGNPFGLDRTLTTGIISRIDYKLNRIQTDAAINPGNSGGPLLNTRGELIGINQAILNPSGRSSAGIGFAIPSNTVKRLLTLSRNARILADSTASPNYGSNESQSVFPKTAYKNDVFLGIAGKTLPNGMVMVLGVAPGSPAANAGMKYQDIVLAVDSVKVNSFDDIGYVLNNKHPGDNINLMYMRNGVVNSYLIKLVPRN
ncbi:MAG: S1C family serine protease [Vampirovibrionia bacterium]